MSSTTSFNKPASTTDTKIWFVIPAAGTGSRMEADRPKQYLSIKDQFIADYTLAAILGCADVKGLDLAGIVVACSDDDIYWPQLRHANHPLIHKVSGGAERADSVLNGLKYLESKVSQDDWVLVHDMARPCITPEDIQRLVSTVYSEGIGGLLAIPVQDTIKKAQKENTTANNAAVAETVDRSMLWQAQTPQMFRHDQLLTSLQQALEQGLTITDEASALEAFDHPVQLVIGSVRNLKVTRPDDLLLAQLFLEQAAKTLSDKDSQS